MDYFDIDVVEYRSCHAKTVEELDKEVNVLIKSEWKPYGSAYMSNQSYIQAMVRVQLP